MNRMLAAINVVNETLLHITDIYFINPGQYLFDFALVFRIKFTFVAVISSNLI